MRNYLSKKWNSPYFTYGQIFAMLLPLILDQFFISVINLLTTAMISSSSQESVSAVSLVSPIYMMIYAVFNAVSSGGTVIIAQYKGQGDKRSMEKAAELIVYSTTLTAVILSAVFIIFARPIINAMYGAADPEIVDKAVMYLIGCAISFIFLAIYLGGFAIFRGIGETKTCLYLSVIINLIHLIASYIFINIMKLDILGTVLALNIARVIGGIVCMYFLYGRKSKSGFTFHFSEIYHPDMSILGRVINISIPFAIEQLCFNGASIITSMYIVKFGTKSVAANAVASAVLMLFYSVGMSVSNLSVTIVGQCIGAKDFGWAKRYGKRIVIMGEWAIILSIAAFLPILRPLLTIYGAPQDTVSLIYKLVIIVLVPMAFFWSSSNVLPNVMRSAGDVYYASVVSLITMWVVRVGLGYILSVTFDLGIEGVWICIGIEYAVRTLIFIIRFRSGKWIKTGDVKY